MSVKRFPSLWLLLAAVFMTAILPAAAQMQTQGMTVGSPNPGLDKKPTRAECLAKGKAQRLRGAKLTAFVKDCLK